MATIHGERAELSTEEYTINRANRARWHALQLRMEARAYREALAMAEPDEPLFRLANAYANERDD
jgi:hypothetical protein